MHLHRESPLPPPVPRMLWESGPGNIPEKSVDIDPHVQAHPPLGREATTRRAAVSTLRRNTTTTGRSFLSPAAGRPGSRQPPRLHRHHLAQWSARLVHHVAADHVGFQ